MKSMIHYKAKAKTRSAKITLRCTDVSTLEIIQANFSDLIDRLDNTLTSTNDLAKDRKISRYDWDRAAYDDSGRVVLGLSTGVFRKDDLGIYVYVPTDWPRTIDSFKIELGDKEACTVDRNVK